MYVMTLHRESQQSAQSSAASSVFAARRSVMYATTMQVADEQGAGQGLRALLQWQAKMRCHTLGNAKPEASL
jgi:hypothetical protein